jgi:hypothetical protein
MISEAFLLITTIKLLGAIRYINGCGKRVFMTSRE